MTIQRSDAARNAANDSFETLITAGGTLAPKLKLFSGTVPANCAAADPSGTLATLTLNTNPFDDSASGVKAKSATAWTGTASGSGTAASYRMYANDGTTCHEQGTVTATGGGGDLTLDNPVLANNQAITISTWSRTASNP